MSTVTEVTQTLDSGEKEEKEKVALSQQEEPERVVPAQAGLSLLQHVKYVGLPQEGHDLLVVSLRDRGVKERERQRQREGKESVGGTPRQQELLHD